MLRDIPPSGNVVKRAQRLAELESPDDAFTATTHCWQSGDGYRREVRQLQSKLTGFEMVVASANNAAVENISEVFSPDAFVEGEDDQGCGGDRGDGSGIEGDVLEGLEVLDQGVGPLGGSPH